MTTNSITSAWATPTYVRLDTPPESVHEAPKLRNAKGMLRVLYGGGNAAVSDASIQAYVTAPGCTAEEVLDAAIIHGVSAEQLSKAMAGHEAFTPQRVQAYLASFGLDRATLVKEVTADWNESDFEQTLLSLGEQGQTLTDLDQALVSGYGRVAPLIAQARAAQDEAAQLEGVYEALAIQVDRGLAEYERWVQEVAAAQALEAQAQKGLALGRKALENAQKVTKKKNRRATAEANAQYQMDASRQRLEYAQTRIDQANKKIAALEAWGLPLLEQKEVARAAWTQAQTRAKEAGDIANAQLTHVAQVAQARNAALAEMTLDHDRLLAYVSAHPDLAAADQVRERVYASVLSLEQTLKDHQAWTDEIVGQGLLLEDEAAALEAHAAALSETLHLDEHMFARSQAEVKLSEAQNEFDASKAALSEAQARLDAAYQARMDANYKDGKKARERARDQGDRQKALAADALRQAHARVQVARGQLNEVHADTIPVIERALKAQAQWAPLNTQALAARNQVKDQVALAGFANTIEGAAQSAMAAAHIQLVGVSQTKVILAQQLAQSGQVNVEELVAIEKSVRLDLEESINALQSYEQLNVVGRSAEMKARARFTERQAHASGQALIADNLMGDAQALSHAIAELGVAGVHAQVAQAKERLSAAQARYEMADMAMDWAEARTHAKKQARDIKAAAPERVAAQTERDDAKHAYDELAAQLATVHVMEAPLKEAAQRAGFAALDALQEAQSAGTRADSAAAWSDIAHSRYQRTDTLVATAQLGMIEGSRALAQLQAVLASHQPDENVAEVLSAEAARTQAWADAYANTVAQARQARADTQAQMRALDALVIDAGAMQTLHTFLEGKVAQAQQDDQTLKVTVVPRLEAYFAQASAQAHQDGQTALEAHQAMVRKESELGLAYVLEQQKKKMTPVGAQQMLGAAGHILTERVHADPSIAAPGTPNGIDPRALHALAQQLAQEENDKRARIQEEDPQSVVDAWLEKELARRKKSTRKQLHVLDDLAQWISADTGLQAARDAALQAAQRAHGAGLEAIRAGQNVQAHIVASVMAGQQVAHTQTLLAQTSDRLAQLHGQAQGQADKLSQALDAEQGAHAQYCKGCPRTLRGARCKPSSLGLLQRRQLSKARSG